MRKIIGNTVGTTMNPQKIASIGQKTKLSEFENDGGFVDKQYVDEAVNEILNGFASALAEVVEYQEGVLGG